MEDLTGIVDIHAHASPDHTARSLDAVELVEMYRDSGMRGVLLMNHHDSTAGVARIVGKQVEGLEIFAGIVLNHLIGGMNRHAVKHFAKAEGQRGRIVYMPTTGSEHEVRQSGNSDRPFVRIAEKGRLLPEVCDMISLIADLGLVMSTGHSSPEEILLLIEEGQRCGVREILVTNPHYWAIDMSIEQMKAAASMGAVIEFIYYCVGKPDATVTIADYADAIRAVGAEHCVLSSCSGQAWLPIHTYAWSQLLGGLRSNGIAQDDLDTMSKINPARLVGLV